METTVLNNRSQLKGHVQPLCPVFKKCGGCLYQDIAYSDELKIKEKYLRNSFCKSFDLEDDIFASIIPSPKPYYYRNRLDLKLKKTKANNVFIGFSPMDHKGVVPVDECFIADKIISDFIPELKRQAIARLPLKYKNANLTVRVGQNGRVLWGGIGRRSCQLSKQDYFWIDVKGRKIFYSLDTFFQANSSILPRLFDVINRFPIWNPTVTFFDLYGGVGLFGIVLSEKVNKVIMIEENIASLSVAHTNIAFNKINNIKIVDGKVEEYLSDLLNAEENKSMIALVDPPRGGLNDRARQTLTGTRKLNHILYLSCNPESLIHDLGEFVQQGWEIQKIIPFDFFPKTKHLEILVLLQFKHRSRGTLL